MTSYNWNETSNVALLLSAYEVLEMPSNLTFTAKPAQGVREYCERIVTRLQQDGIDVLWPAVRKKLGELLGNILPLSSAVPLVVAANIEAGKHATSVPEILAQLESRDSLRQTTTSANPSHIQSGQYKRRRVDTGDGGKSSAEDERSASDAAGESNVDRCTCASSGPESCPLRGSLHYVLFRSRPAAPSSAATMSSRAAPAAASSSSFSSSTTSSSSSGICDMESVTFADDRREDTIKSFDTLLRELLHYRFVTGQEGVIAPSIGTDATSSEQEVLLMFLLQEGSVGLMVDCSANFPALQHKAYDDGTQRCLLWAIADMHRRIFVGEQKKIARRVAEELKKPLAARHYVCADVEQLTEMAKERLAESFVVKALHTLAIGSPDRTRVCCGSPFTTPCLVILM